ncbi:MAG: hypothetical protein KTR16_02490 [Acidiferrobacterales bacterium]|nr:hypothetical protein [Acidiferrobacterales bacterium]
MKTNNLILKLNQIVKALIAITVLTFSLSQTSFAQDVSDIRWKSESHVRSLYGEPNSIQGPIGTHATYELWKYDNFSVAFANNRAFHLFNKDSLTKEVELEENRPQ